MSHPFIISWHDFVVYAMLQVKNGWPILDDDEIVFLDKDDKEIKSLPAYVKITLHKSISK